MAINFIIRGYFANKLKYENALKRINSLLTYLNLHSDPSVSYGQFIAGTLSTSYPKRILSLESPPGSHIVSHAKEYFSDRQKIKKQNVRTKKKKKK